MLTGLISAILNRLEARRAYQRRIDELMSYSDRDLQELGVDRSDIPALAR